MWIRAEQKELLGMKQSLAFSEGKVLRAYGHRRYLTGFKANEAWTVRKRKRSWHDAAILVIQDDSAATESQSSRQHFVPFGE
jgi:hypothetical protein